MKKRLQGIAIGMLISALLFAVVVFAKSGSETIEVIYDNISIYLDGVKIEPKDANGKTVEPFIYNGTTYLPVRAIGEAIGKKVSWDDATKSVYLGEFSLEQKYNNAMQLYRDKKYAEATWTFDELGEYENSKEMKEKCERSWRKSLSSVVTYNYLGGMDTPLYSVTADGVVVDNYNVGDAHTGLELNEHGRIVSIGDNSKLYALREDGYVDNASQSVGINEWNDIIQISPVLDGRTNVALNSKGQMVYGDVNWASEMSDWNRIVAFETYNNVQQGGAMVIGLTSDGKLQAVADEVMKSYISGDFNAILKNFENVVKFDFSVEILSGKSYAEALNIVALTTDNMLISYTNGVFEKKEVEDMVDVKVAYDIYDGYRYKIHCLKDDGKYIDTSTNELVLENVVRIDDEFCITRDGSVYYIYYDFEGKAEKTKENGFAAVYDEWLETLKF